MIILIRHGEIPAQVENPDLTEKGREQARQLAKKLSQQKIDKCVVSTLKRARQTWEEFDRIKKIPVEHTQQAIEIYRTIIGGPEREGTRPERVEEDSKRADKFYEGLMKEKKNVAVFTHGNMINYLIAKTIEQNPKERWSTTIGYTSITIIDNGRLVKENAAEF